MKKMIQAEIARSVGISEAMVSRILHRKRRPSPNMAIRLEMATGVWAAAWLWPDKYDNRYIPKNDE